jgi:hypothetical protein
VECIGNDVPYGELNSFPQAVQAKDNEVVIFSDQFSLFLRGMLGSGAKTASDRQRNSQSALH